MPFAYIFVPLVALYIFLSMGVRVRVCVCVDALIYVNLFWLFSANAQTQPNANVWL